MKKPSSYPIEDSPVEKAPSNSSTAENIALGKLSESELGLLAVIEKCGPVGMSLEEVFEQLPIFKLTRETITNLISSQLLTHTENLKFIHYKFMNR